MKLIDVLLITTFLAFIILVITALVIKSTLLMVIAITIGIMSYAISECEE